MGDGFFATSWWSPDCAGTTLPGVIFSLEAETWDEEGAWESWSDTCHLSNNIAR